MISLPLIKYVLKAAVRDRIILSLLLLVLVGTSIAVFIGSSAVSESSAFALVFTAGGLRFTGVAGLVLFAVFHIRRAFDSKDVEFLLSRPLSRPAFLISHAAAFSLLACFMAACVGAAVLLVSPHNIGVGHLLWIASILSEFIIMVNAALFFAMVLPAAAAGVLATFAFYVMARLMGQFLGIVDAGVEFRGDEILGGIMDIIALVIPRLDLMGQTSWLIYGPSGDIGFALVALQGAVCSALLVAAATVDLVRRQF